MSIQHIVQCLASAKLCLSSRVPACNFATPSEAQDARDYLEVALDYARALPNNTKHRAIRAHIVAALEALK